MGNFQSCTKIIESKPNYTKEEIKQKELLCIKSECKIPGELNDWSMFYLHKHIKCARKYGFHYQNYFNMWSVWVAIDSQMKCNYSADEKNAVMKNTLRYLRSNSGWNNEGVIPHLFAQHIDPQIQEQSDEGTDRRLFYFNQISTI